MITTGDAAADDATPAMAYAPTAAAPRATPDTLSAPTRTAMAAPAAAPRREAPPRLTAPRTDGPGIPRLITAQRFGNAPVDLRHPDAKVASALLRGSRGALDVRFTRGRSNSLPTTSPARRSSRCRSPASRSRR